MDFDGRELTRVYLDKQDLNTLLEEVRTFQTIDELEAFLLKHGENIVDLMGGEIDRIEMKLRVSERERARECQSLPISSCFFTPRFFCRKNSPR